MERLRKLWIALASFLFLITIGDPIYAQSRKGPLEEIDHKGFSSRAQDGRKGETTTLRGANSGTEEESLPSRDQWSPSSGGGMRVSDVQTLQPKPLPPPPPSTSCWGHWWQTFTSWFGK